MGHCPLCQNSNFLQDIPGPTNRRFILCNHCFLIHSPQRPSPDFEKLHYLNHQNGPENKEYIKFINQAVEPALQFLTSGMSGMDYGCGHDPVLSQLLPEDLPCVNYDPYFFPEDPTGKFDFIFATECIEHFFNPFLDFKKISSLLNSGGFLILMTDKWSTAEAFTHWYYAIDPTHVSFYHAQTINFIVKTFGFISVWEGKRVNILKSS